MDSWGKMLANQLKIQEQFTKLLPDMSYVKAIQRNFQMMEKIVNPHKDLIAQFNKFEHLIQSPVLSQSEQLTKAANQFLPHYLDSFLLSSSILEAYRHTNIAIPNYFADLAKINKSLVDSTNLFSSELENKLNYDYLKTPLFFDNIPSFLIAPVISGSAHFQVLKNLNYIDMEVNEESEEEYYEIVDENCSIVETKIKAINRDWLFLLKGAEQSIISRNPDKVRHTITSLRELITQILHSRAPDDDIKKTFPDPKYYHKGKPTRCARIKYILVKKYDDSLLEKIIDSDTTSILALFNLYQEGTHKIVSSLNDEELLWILKRTKLLIEQLI